MVSERSSAEAAREAKVLAQVERKKKATENL
jgi:hypothetical protein